MKEANVSATRFIRTTEQAHHRAAQHIWVRTNDPLLFLLLTSSKRTSSRRRASYTKENIPGGTLSQTNASIPTPRSQRSLWRVTTSEAATSLSKPDPQSNGLGKKTTCSACHHSATSSSPTSRITQILYTLQLGIRKLWTLLTTICKKICLSLVQKTDFLGVFPYLMILIIPCTSGSRH